MNYVGGNKVELSLIIDDTNRTVLELDLKNTTDQKLQNICASIVTQYELPAKIEKRLYQQISKEFSHMKKKQKSIEKQRQDTVQRLYYQSINREKEKFLEIETKRKESVEKQMKECNFTPRINPKSNLLYSRDFYRIEDRLYYEDKLSREKQNIKNFIEDIKNRGYSQKKIKKITKNSDSNLEDIKLTEETDKNLITSSKNKTTLKTIQEADSQSRQLNDENLNIQTPAFINKNDTPTAHQNLRTTLGAGLGNNLNSVGGNSSNPNFFRESNKNPQQRKISFKSSFNAASNSYSEKYEKILNQKTQNAQNSIIIQGQTPQVTRPPTPKKENCDHQDKNKNFYSSQEVPEIKMKNKTNQNELSLDIFEHLEHFNSNKNFYNNFNIDGTKLKQLEDEGKISPIVSPYRDGSTPVIQKQEVLKNNLSQRLIRSTSLPNNKKHKKYENKSNAIQNNQMRENKKISHSQGKIKKIKQLSDKNNQEDCYERLYKSNEMIKAKKQEMLQRQNKSECPFIPKISKETKKILTSSRKNETEKHFINRLTYSKKMNSLNNLKVSQNSKPSNKKSLVVKVKQNKIDEEKNLEGFSTLSKSQNFSSGNNTQKQLYLNTEESKPRKSYREYKTEMRLNTDINEIRRAKAETSQIVKEQFSNNLNRLKNNHIKELYEAVIRESQGDKKELENIPSHIRQNLLVPTLQIIQNRNLSLNFENFYTISNEILDKFFYLS